MNHAALAALRHERGLTQVELATRSGLTQGHITDLERGRVKSPGINTLVALAKGFDMELNEFLDKVNPKEAATSAA